MQITPHFSSLWIAFLAVAGGLVGLATGGEMLANGAARLGKNFGMSSLLIGLTVVTFGTSMPVLFVSLTASLQNHPDLMIGNVVGSNLFNLLMVMGAAAAVSPFSITLDVSLRDLPVMVAFSLVLLPIIKFRQRISRLHVFFLLLSYLFYLYLLA